MIAHTFQDAFGAQWVKTHLSDSTHDLIILRHIIPWQSIVDCLVPFYHADKGRNGQSLRIMVAITIVAKLRLLSDRTVIQAIQENRYIQYFCNIPDRDLRHFLHHSTLSTFRKRLGEQGVAIIEGAVFD